MEFIGIYGSFFIQFVQFTYIRVGGFQGEPFRLPRYALDSYVLIEVSSQLAYIDKRSGGKSRVVFQVELGYYSCRSVLDALNIELEFKKFNLQLFVARNKFDSRRFAIENLNVDDGFCREP